MIDAITTVTYRKEQYGCHLWIREKRIGQARELLDAERIRGVLARFLRRCVRDDPSIVVGTDVKVSVAQDFMTEQWLLRATVPAFQDVAPEDVEILTYWVDVPNAQAVQIPRIPPVSLMATNTPTPPILGSETR